MGRVVDYNGSFHYRERFAKRSFINEKPIPVDMVRAGAHCFALWVVAFHMQLYIVDCLLSL
jgi:hypothetical protein